jgi:hypothetical protein
MATTNIQTFSGDVEVTSNILMNGEVFIKTNDGNGKVGIGLGAGATSQGNDAVAVGRGRGWDISRQLRRRCGVRRAIKGACL